MIATAEVYRRHLFRRAASLMMCASSSSCGFHPVYQRDAKGVSGPAQSGLAAIQIANIPNRPGQILRQALQARFEREGMGIAHRYDLYVGFGISSENVSTEQDSSITRNRLVGTASWSLVSQDPARPTLSTGVARSVDGADVVNEQFFAADLSVEAAQRRICEAVAEQMTQQLAAYFLRKEPG